MTASAVTTTLFTSHDEPRPKLTLIRGDGRAPETIRVAVAEGHRLVRAGVSALLEREAGIAVAGEATSGEKEDTMLTPNVIEIRRGSAHGATVGLTKATAASSQHAE
jgi:hypothetical protein